jgi:outer membrane protein TolC
LGAKVTHNLLNLYRLPKLQQHSRKRLELEEQKRLALSLAVITKFHVALANFNALRDEYEFSSVQSTTSDTLAQIMRSRYRAGEIALHECLSAELFALDARLSTELLGAELVSAAGQIYTNLGIDIVPAGTVNNDLSVLSGVLEGQVRGLSDINQKLISLAAEKAPLSL